MNGGVHVWNTDMCGLTHMASRCIASTVLMDGGRRCWPDAWNLANMSVSAGAGDGLPLPVPLPFSGSMAAAAAEVHKTSAAVRRSPGCFLPMSCSRSPWEMITCRLRSTSAAWVLRWERPLTQCIAENQYTDIYNKRGFHKGLVGSDLEWYGLCRYPSSTQTRHLDMKSWQE